MLASRYEISRVLHGRARISTWHDMKPHVYYKANKPYGLIAANDTTGVMLINSIAVDDQPFTFEMLRALRQHITSHEQVVLMSTRKESTAIARLMDSFVEAGNDSHFIKGV